MQKTRSFAGLRICPGLSRTDAARAALLVLGLALGGLPARATARDAAADGDAADFAPVDPSAFMTLPEPERDARQRSAADWVAKWEDFEKTMARGRRAEVQARMEGTIADVATITAQRSYWGSGVPRAIAWLANATVADPRRADAWLALAALCDEVGSRGRAAAALRGARAALDADASLPPDDRRQRRLELTRLEAWLAYAECRWSDGLRGLEGARDVDPRDPELMLVKGLLLAAAGRSSEANMIATDMPPIEYRVYGTWQTGLRKARADYGRRWIEARIYLTMGQPRMALFALGELHPRREQLPYGERYWNDVGLVYELNDRPLEAARFYGVGLLSAPHFGFYPWLGFSGEPRVLGQPDARVPCFVSWEDRWLGGSRFVCAAQLAAEAGGADASDRADRKGEMADSLLTRCIRADDRPTAALALRGELRAVRQQDDLAVADLAQAHREFTAQGLRHARTSLLLGIFQLRDRKLAPAIGLLRECTQADSGLASGWRMLGVALAEGGQPAEARQAMDRAVAMAPKSPDGWYNRGVLAMAGQTWEEAAADLRVAATLEPNDARIARALARAQLHLPGGAAASATTDAGVAVPEPLPLRTDNLTSGADALRQPAPPRQPRGLSPADTAASLSFRELESAWRRHPTAERRATVAAAAAREGLTDEALKILLPAWGRDLSPAEICIVLDADRRRGDARRAVTLARAVAPDRPQPADPALWSLVAVICLDQGHAAEGRRALDAAITLDPGNAGLRLFSSSLERGQK